MRILFFFLVSLSLFACTMAMTPEASRSFEAFSQKAEAGDPQAMYRLSAILEKGYDSIPADTARSLSLLRRAAEAGLPEARNYLGFLFRNGNMVKADPDSAVYWLSRAADAGDPRAAHNLAYLLLFPPDSVYSSILPPDSAVAYLRRAADAGLPQSMTLLADLYEKGRLVEKDTLHAITLYESAIARHFPDAELRLLNMMGPTWRLLDSKGSLKEALMYWNIGAYTIAVDLLRQVGPADPETPRAYALLGHATSRGLGTPYDHRKANEYFARAAIMGEPSAQFILAETLEIFPDALCELLPDAPESMTPQSLRQSAARAGITSPEAALRALLSLPQ